MLPGRIGHFFILLGFVSAALSAVSFFKATQARGTEKHQGWLRLGRLSFIIHGISVFVAIATIFYLMINQLYEYHYAWEHVSADLPMKYIFSAFWEGQEGSFLLWMFWHVILGFILIFRKGKWEAPVLATLAVIEFIIISMIVGVYFTDSFKLGSSPFLLLRDTMNAPIFNNADYLSMIEGTGLNPLLQNYWMTIHPPTLFLGFASTAIPFAFAIAGLWIKDHIGFLNVVKPWALFSGAILGTGILMGGAWAYEALSFGGYWAWDPVENMSLVPWILLIAGIHSNLIAKNTGYSLKSTYIFYLLTFVMIVYSTFLTRSGVLGDESVHAFTEMGLEWQLVGFLLIFSILGLVMYLRESKNMPAPVKEEKLPSREFWMFIGTLVLFFSAVLITFTTSIPVYNKIFDGIGYLIGQEFEHLHRSMPVERELHFNRYQLWIGVFIALLSGVAQVMRYRAANWEGYRRKFMSNVFLSLVGGGVLAFVISRWIQTFNWQNTALLIAGCFAIVSNLDYMFRFIKLRWQQMGSTLAHLGFGIMLVGILASGTNKRVISQNKFAQSGLIDKMDVGSNISLIKGLPMFMEGYWVTYQRDTFDHLTRTFLIDYKRVDENQDTIERFTLRPNVLYNKQFTKVDASNPDTKHYLGRDIFTHIAALPAAQMDMEKGRALDSLLDFKIWQLQPGDTIATDTLVVHLESIQMGLNNKDYKPQPGDLAFSATLKLRRETGSRWYETTPGLVLRQSLLYRYPTRINDLNTIVEIPDDMINKAFQAESSLKYTEFSLRQNEEITIGGVRYRLTGINKQPSHSNYIPEEGDIAINAILEASRPGFGESATLQPLFLIRGNTPYNFKDYAPGISSHVRFLKIDPQSETFYFSAAIDEDKPLEVGFRIAENAPRDDIVVLEAIEFPGINLFWLGSILMMLGFTVRLFVKRSQKADS